MFEVIKILTISILAHIARGSEIGDHCLVQSSKTDGKCVRFADCPSALQAFNQNKVFPQTCGFEKITPLVCCANSSTTVSEQSSTAKSELMLSIITELPSTTNTNKEDEEPTTRSPGDISRQKCREYAKYAYTTSTSPILSIILDRAETSNDDCGITNVRLIADDGSETPATEKEFPHMAVIGFEPTPGDIKWQCGGSLISPQFILTAGHCLFSPHFGQSKYVRLGLRNLEEHAHMQQYNIKEQIRHPEYNSRTFYDDIALLKLDKPATMTAYVRPACLNTQFDIPQEKAIASGWGQIAFASDSKSDDLMRVIVELSTQTQCNDSYQNNTGKTLDKGILEDRQLCAGRHFGKKRGICKGDSGGPLQIYHIEEDVKCMYDLIGVASFGIDCGSSRDPGVYTRVSKYIQWIEDTVWLNE